MSMIIENGQALFVDALNAAEEKIQEDAVT